jgi:hypothetical protein
MDKPFSPALLIVLTSHDELIAHATAQAYRLAADHASFDTAEHREVVARFLDR